MYIWYFLEFLVTMELHQEQKVIKQIRWNTFEVNIHNVPCDVVNIKFRYRIWYQNVWDGGRGVVDEGNVYCYGGKYRHPSTPENAWI